LLLAGELKTAGVDAVAVERRATQVLVGSRERGIHSRTIEVLDQRGIADRFLAEGSRYSWARSPVSASTSATSRRDTTTASRWPRASSSASWPVGSTSSGCRSSAGAT
jgi:2-polyprenyl-6-methoxyphenol hydroxylase-like FAD-dependent oxidoreductase